MAPIDEYPMLPCEWNTALGVKSSFIIYLKLRKEKYFTSRWIDESNKDLICQIYACTPPARISEFEEECAAASVLSVAAS